LSTLHLAKSEFIILGKEERDGLIEKWLKWIEILDQVDVRVTVFTWEASGVWSSLNN